MTCVEMSVELLLEQQSNGEEEEKSCQIGISSVR